MTRSLLQRWSSNIDLDIARQIQVWDEEGGSPGGGTTPYSFTTD